MPLTGSMGLRRSNIEPENDIALRLNHGPYAAHEILKECTGTANEKVCPHDSVNRLSFSGTKLREIFLSGQQPPPELVRPDVSEVVSRWHGPFVE
jgi:ATP sulfurylase